MLWTIRLNIPTLALAVTLAFACLFPCSDDAVASVAGEVADAKAGTSISPAERKVLDELLGKGVVGATASAATIKKAEDWFPLAARATAFTTTYGRNKGIMHPCPASEGELFMPPGIGLGDITAPGLKDVYHALAFDNYSGAARLVREVKATTKMDKFIRDYLTIAIEVEADWQLECIEHVAAVGDLYTVSLLIDRTRGKFGDSLNKRLRPYEKRLTTISGAEIVAIGKAYLAACAAKDLAAVAAICTNHGDTVYAQAATQHLAATKAGKSAHPLQWFLTVDRYLARYEYLSPN